jgi:hypothetical protein
MPAKALETPPSTSQQKTPARLCGKAVSLVQIPPRPFGYIPNVTRAPLLLLVLFLAACERVDPPPPAPRAEFIVAAGDSVFWIRSDIEGIRVRGAPMVLAEVGGRFAELYVADEDHSFYDAVFVGQRLYKRDLINGDSAALYGDTLMGILARSYAAANPDERPLSSDEQGSENPRTIGSAEIFVLDVLGPWVSYEYRTDVDVVGGTSAHGVRRGVLDLRTGAPTTLEALFGQRPARLAANEGRAQWRSLRDSVSAAARESGASDFADELQALVFEPKSFVLGVEEREPRVRFTLVQSASPVASGALELFPIAVEEPVWWATVAGQHALTGDLDERLWRREEYTLVARAALGTNERMAVALRDDGGTEWRLGFVPAPVLRVMWLDDSTLVPGTREALTRAFNDASLYSEDARVVSGRRRAVRTPQWRLVSHERPAARTPRRNPPARSRP